MNFKHIDMHTAGIYVCLYLLMFKTLAVARGGYSHSGRNSFVPRQYPMRL